jgi:hypothetical protein
MLPFFKVHHSVINKSVVAIEALAVVARMFIVYFAKIHLLPDVIFQVAVLCTSGHAPNATHAASQQKIKESFHDVGFVVLIEIKCKGTIIFYKKKKKRIFCICQAHSDYFFVIL